MDVADTRRGYIDAVLMFDVFEKTCPYGNICSTCEGSDIFFLMYGKCELRYPEINFNNITISVFDDFCQIKGNGELIVIVKEGKVEYLHKFAEIDNRLLSYVIDAQRILANQRRLIK